MPQEAFKGYRQNLLAVAAAVLMAALLPTISLSQNPNPRVLPPNSDAFGMTYGEWSARWWQWAVSLPTTAHPLFDNAPCSKGQLGKVWFLGGSFTGTPADRTCNVPAGKALFFPIIDADCSDVEAPPFFGATPEARRICAINFNNAVLAAAGGISSLSAEVDGVSIQDLAMYRVASPDVPFVAPADNVLIGPSPASGFLSADGFYLLLAPLSVGEHTIHFSAPGQDVTYHLTVGK